MAILLSTLYHYFALFGAYAVLSLVGMFIVCVALYRPVMKWANTIPDGSGKPLPGLRPEEAERPAIPKAVIVHLSFWDRVEQRRFTAEEIQANQEYWEAFKARMDEIRKVERGERV